MNETWGNSGLNQLVVNRLNIFLFRIKFPSDPIRDFEMPE